MSDVIQRVEETLSSGGRVSQADILELIAEEYLQPHLVIDETDKYVVTTINLPSGRVITIRDIKQ